MLSRIKLGFPELRRALLGLDDQELSVDDLRAISKQLPTSEEVSDSNVSLVLSLTAI
jgi:diaphanous 1